MRRVGQGKKKLYANHHNQKIATSVGNLSEYHKTMDF